MGGCGDRFYVSLIFALTFNYGKGIKVLSRVITSNVTSGGALQANSAFLSCQSKDFTWSASTTPDTAKPSKRGTSNGYPLAFVVIGHTKASPTRRLYLSGEITIAGRRPACSRPI